MPIDEIQQPILPEITHIFIGRLERAQDPHVLVSMI